MALYKQACNEVIQFLEDLQGTAPALPDVIAGHWRDTVAICRDGMPDWSQAESLCNCMVSVLNRLRSGGADFGQIDGAHGQVLVLLGAMNLGQKHCTKASSHFQQGARRLRERNQKALESLAYFGLALTHKQEKHWSMALVAAQKALNTIRDLPPTDRSTQTKRLEKQIEEEVEAIGDAYRRDTEASKPLPIPIPIVTDIAAGSGVIAEENVEDYLFLDEEHHNGADFGVRVVGDSMRDDCILPGDIVLIRQQPRVENGEIAALVIELGSRRKGVLKRYRFHEKEDLQHWFLESSNPASEHVVVIPSGAKAALIRALFARAIRSGRIRNLIRYYEDAEVTVAGKYVGLVRER